MKILNIRSFALFIFIICVVFLISIPNHNEVVTGMAPSEKWISVEFPSGGKIEAEVAYTPLKRKLGLSFREDMALDRGMLFIFDAPNYYGFGMKDCLFPLDILWLDNDGQVVHMEEQLPPCKSIRCPTYMPYKKAMYVLEVNTDIIKREKIQIGDVLQF